MQRFINKATGKRVDVVSNGKSFTTYTHYPATKHSPAETVQRKHRYWSQVEKRISDCTPITVGGQS